MEGQQIQGFGGCKMTIVDKLEISMFASLLILGLPTIIIVTRLLVG